MFSCSVPSPVVFCSLHALVGGLPDLWNQYTVNGMLAVSRLFKGNNVSSEQNVDGKQNCVRWVESLECVLDVNNNRMFGLRTMFNVNITFAMDKMHASCNNNRMLDLSRILIVNRMLCYGQNVCWMSTTTECQI